MKYNFYFKAKIFLNELPELFILLLVFVLWIYYSIIIRILEIGWYNEIKGSDFSEKSDTNFDNIIIFQYYKNCFWNVYITMTHIGYGDIVIGTFASRILIGIISFTAIFLTNASDVNHFIFF